MIVEVYTDGTATVKGNKDLSWLLDKDASLLRTIEGEDWEDCMRQHFELMGWDPYIPME